MNKLLKTVKTWSAQLRTKDNLIVIIAVLAALAVMLGVTAAFMLKPAKYDQNTPTPTPVPTDTQARDPLTGAPLAAPVAVLPQVYAVMVENSADAWPLSGLDQAFLVIEAPVEGNIPRFITFFSGEQDASGQVTPAVEKIGPVRSARPYYLDWASEFDAIYAHVGGSPEALDLIQGRSGFLDLNEFSQGEYFWRDVPRRQAPHNAYTSTAELGKSVAELQPPAPNYGTWLFKDDAPIGANPASLAINWGEGSLYDVAWTYDPGTNAYTRHEDGSEDKTQDGHTITANNVVVMASDITVVDGVGRRHIRTLGSGDALVVQDGKIILGTWKKDTVDTRLRFYAADGSEIKMNAGKTWIEVVPSIDRASTTTTLP